MGTTSAVLAAACTRLATTQKKGQGRSCLRSPHHWSTADVVDSKTMTMALPSSEELTFAALIRAFLPMLTPTALLLDPKSPWPAVPRVALEVEAASEP